ncbi:MAG: lysoplasmalogenase [Cyclobacteriaceae bacterium]|jgi:uncharacterized membrane protein YhhN
MISRLLLVLFFFLSFLHLIFISSSPGLGFFTKPLLIPVLLGYYLLVQTIKHKSLIIALIACWIGDCLLMFTEVHSTFFLAGLTAFLTGHILYIFCFRTITGPEKVQTPALGYLLSILPVALAGWLIGTLWSGLGSFQIPVLIYTLVIATMFLHAVRRLNRTNSKSFQILLSGAFLFMLSDSLLAYNMFGSSIPFSGLLVMSTYLSAQYLIVKGVLEHN